MSSKNQPKRQSVDLRRRAKERVAKRSRTAVAMCAADVDRLNHELVVRQVELEIQNEELRLASAKLEASYDELYDFAPVGYFTLGRKGNIEKANLTGASMLGQPRSRLLGRPFARFVSPESLLCFDDFLCRIMGGYGKVGCMLTLTKGGVTPVVAHIEATGTGSDSSCRAVVVDITSAEQARLALREREAHLNLALAASDMGVWECERDTGDIYWSPECMEIFGVDSFSPTLDTLARLVHPEDAPRVRSIVSQALADGKEQTVEFRIVRPDTRVVWIRARGQVQFGSTGKPLRLIGIAQDVTERRWAEQHACPLPEYRTRCGANFIVACSTNLLS
jgi:PAS domain S-box-containing protein